MAASGSDLVELVVSRKVRCRSREARVPPKWTRKMSEPNL